MRRKKVARTNVKNVRSPGTRPRFLPPDHLVPSSFQPSLASKRVSTEIRKRRTEATFYARDWHGPTQNTQVFDHFIINKMTRQLIQRYFFFLFLLSLIKLVILKGKI